MLAQPKGEMIILSPFLKSAIALFGLQFIDV